MEFDKIIDNFLGEGLSREDRIKVLKSMSTDRDFNVEVYGGRGVKNFEVSGETLFDALKQLPEVIFKEIFDNVDDFSDFEEEDKEKEVFDILNVSYGEGGLNVNVYEDGILLCGCDSPDAYSPEEEYDDDIVGDEEEEEQ